MKWKEIQGNREIYLISDTGIVRRADRIGTRNNFCKGAELSYHENSAGYYRVGLNITGKHKEYFVHRLVAEAFVPKVDGKNYVNHIDGDKHNNCASNLEWCSFKENISHAWNSGMYSQAKCKASSLKGEKHPMHKLSQADVDWIRENHIPWDKTFGSVPLADKFGVRPQTITDIVHNHIWRISA